MNRGGREREIPEHVQHLSKKALIALMYLFRAGI